MKRQRLMGSPSRIVGSYFDTGGNAHGFVESVGQFTTIDVPGATSTSAVGINPNGEIVGQFIDGGGNEHGFLLSLGRFTTIDFPGAIATAAFAKATRS
jgi:hypothetical protein